MPAARRFARLLIVLSLAALGCLLGIGASTAEAPMRVPQPITDDAGVLSSADEARIQEATDSLFNDHGLQLWVVYVNTFNGIGYESWINQTADNSDFGPNDALLAVAVQDRSYGLWVSPENTSVSDSDFASIETNSVEPALRNGDWAGAAVAAADGFSNAYAGINPAILIGVGGVAVAGAGGLVVRSRIKRKRALDRGVDDAREIDPTDTARLAKLPIEVLDERAKEILVETDNAILNSADELQLAVDELGQVGAAGFSAAMDRAKAASARAFQIRQQLEDSIPETPQQRRDMLIDIIKSCGTADRELDAEVEKFDQTRNLLIEAPSRLDALTQQQVAIIARLPESQRILDNLRAKYPASVLDPVDDNIDLARHDAELAEQNIDAGRKAVVLPAGQQGPVVDAIRTAEAALGQATALLDAVDHADAAIAAAIANLPSALADLRADIDKVGSVREHASQELLGAQQNAREALAAAEANGSTDPLGSAQRVAQSDAELGRLLAAAIDEKDRFDRASQRAIAGIQQAQSAITAANDFITTRRGGIGAEARTNLAEAQRQLGVAQQQLQQSPEAAEQSAATAARLASSAIARAKSDVATFESRNRPTGGGSGFNAGVLAGVLVEGMIRGSAGGSRGRSGGFGGGFGGGGGHRGPSFGGSGSSGRVRGGRF